MKAGGHWDPDKTGNHSYPWDDKGHKGDLPSLYVNADGVANVPVLAPKLKTLDEVRNHALMIHVGGDNFHDHPAALGGGGARMAAHSNCGAFFCLTEGIFRKTVRRIGGFEYDSHARLSNDGRCLLPSGAACRLRDDQRAGSDASGACAR